MRRQTNPTAINTKTGAIDSNVTVAYAAAGGGIHWHYEDSALKTHIDEYGTVPMILSCGQSDSYCWGKWAPMLEYKGETSGSIFFAIPMEDKGHEYPNGVDPLRDYQRYDAFNTFIKGYLFPEDYAPSVAYITPKDGSRDVAFTSTIEVQFIANTQIAIGQVEENVTVSMADGTEVTGTWSTDTVGLSNLFTFTPDTLEFAKEYIVTVSSDLTDGNGKSLRAEKAVSFKTEGLYVTEAVGGTYVSEAEPD